MSANNGRLVKEARTTLDGNEYVIAPDIGHVVICENEFHGDHDEDWLVMRTMGERKEVERFNMRFVSYIAWADQ